MSGGDFTGWIYSYLAELPCDHSTIVMQTFPRCQLFSPQLAYVLDVPTQLQLPIIFQGTLPALSVQTAYWYTHHPNLPCDRNPHR